MTNTIAVLVGSLRTDSVNRKLAEILRDQAPEGVTVDKPFGVVGTTPTPYGGKWAHADAARSARVAGAVVVEDITVSQSAVEVDVLTDPDVLARLHGAVRALADYDVAGAAA